jgi:hypothetical protein
MPEKNPYEKADGTPIEGKEFEFLDWAIEQDKKRIAKLSPKEQKEEQKAANHLRDKMES